MKTGRDLNSLAQELTRQAETKKDYVADSRSFSAVFRDNVPGINIRNGESHDYGITSIGHEQLAERLEIPRKYYERMTAKSPELWAHNVNYWLEKEPKRHMLRTLDGKVRACLSDRFRPLDNYDVGDTLLPVVLAQPNARVESCEITDRKFYLKIVTPKVEGEVTVGDPVQAGLVISNSEVGLGALNAQLMIYRLVCKNGMISAGKEFGMRTNHSGKQFELSDFVQEYYSDKTRALDNQAFFAKLKDAISGFLSGDGFKRVLERMRASKEDKIMGDPVQAVEVLQKQAQLSDTEKGGILRHLCQGGEFTRYGLMNAVTRHSQDVSDYDRATELEALGGKIIDIHPYQWRSIADAGAVVVR